LESCRIRSNEINDGKQTTVYGNRKRRKADDGRTDDETGNGQTDDGITENRLTDDDNGKRRTGNGFFENGA